MSTSTTRRPGGPVDASGTGGDDTTGTARGVTLARVVVSEWVKLRSLRSTTYVLVTVLVTLLGFGTFAAIGTVVADVPDPEGGTIDPLGGALYGVSPVELVVGALGVLAVSGEYASGAIRSTFAAVPRRVPVVLAKAAVVAATVLVVALAGILLAFTVDRVLLATDGTRLSLGAPGVLRALVGGALYLAVVAALGVGFGWLVRSTAGGLAALFALLYVLPVLGLLLPGDLRADVIPILPTNAGIAVMQVSRSGLLPPWVGLAVFVGYAAALLLVSAGLVRRRDA